MGTGRRADALFAPDDMATHSSVTRPGCVQRASAMRNEGLMGSGRCGGRSYLGWAVVRGGPDSPETRHYPSVRRAWGIRTMRSIWIPIIVAVAFAIWVAKRSSGGKPSK